MAKQPMSDTVYTSNTYVPTSGYVAPTPTAKSDSSSRATLSAEERAILNITRRTGEGNEEPVVTPPGGDTPPVPPGGATYTQEQVDKLIADAVAKGVADFTNKSKETTRANTTTALEDFRNNLKLAGLDSLADAINNMILEDKTSSQIRIDITKEQAYKDRFPGMAALAAKGKAINESTYIATERAFEGTMLAYGIDKNVFGTREKMGKYISNLTSPDEFESRVQMAAERVNANADVTAALEEYYGVSKGAALTWLLNPELGLDIVKKEVRSAEIGAAATGAGFKDFVTRGGFGVAESFINAAGTKDLQSLKTEFGKARLLADTQGRLASLEGENYNDMDAVTAVITQNQQSLLESQKRAAREQARFGGNSAINASSLKTQSNI
jgi:hypothetical protein